MSNSENRLRACGGRYLGDTRMTYCVFATEHMVQVEDLAQADQDLTDQIATLAYVHLGYTKQNIGEVAQTNGIVLEAVKHAGAERRFVLLPCGRMVERSLEWAHRFRRLSRDYES